MPTLTKHKTLSLLFVIMFGFAFGQNVPGDGIIKFDFDSTKIYVSIGEIISLNTAPISDSVFSLLKLTDADTVVCTRYNTLKYKAKTYTFDIRPALQKAIEKRNCTIYFKGQEVPARSFHTIKKKNKYYYHFAFSRQPFFILNTTNYILINESW